MKRLLILVMGLLCFSCTYAPAFAQNVRTFIPVKAHVYAHTLRQEQLEFWPDHPKAFTLGGLVEQESCVSLTSKRCWDPESKLKTDREEGAGFGQITRAYRADGSLRFDSLTGMAKQYPKELGEWNWGNVYKRPDLQLRALVLMSKDNYRALYAIKDPDERLYFTDAAYNGGMPGVANDRRLCSLKEGCDPQKWFGHVELTCSKSKTPIYGNRSACMINREHVYNVFKLRSDKYKLFFPFP